MSDEPMCQTPQEIEEEHIFLQELKDYEESRQEEEGNGQKHIDVLIAKALRLTFIRAVQAQQDASLSRHYLENRIEKIIERLEKYPSLLYLLYVMPGVVIPLLMVLPILIGYIVDEKKLVFLINLIPGVSVTTELVTESGLFIVLLLIGLSVYNLISHGRGVVLAGRKKKAEEEMAEE